MQRARLTVLDAAPIESDSLSTSRPARVLIADDETAIVELLDEVLLVEGYEIRTVSTGSDALAVAQTFHPHVILLDIAMSDLSGDTVLRMLRERGSQAPVIAISARPELAGPGFFAVLAKPMSLAGVTSVVSLALQHGRADNGLTNCR